MQVPRAHEAHAQYHWGRMRVQVVHPHSSLFQCQPLEDVQLSSELEV